MPQTQNLTDPNQRATTVKKPGHYKNQCCLMERQKEPSEDSQNIPGNENNGANTSIPNNNTNKNNNNNNHKKVIPLKQTQKLFIHPVRHVGRQRKFHQSLTLSGSHPKRLIQLICIGIQLLKLIKIPKWPNSDRQMM